MINPPPRQITVAGLPHPFIPSSTTVDQRFAIGHGKDIASTVTATVRPSNAFAVTVTLPSSYRPQPNGDVGINIDTFAVVAPSTTLDSLPAFPEVVAGSTSSLDTKISFPLPPPPDTLNPKSTLLNKTSHFTDLQNTGPGIVNRPLNLGQPSFKSVSSKNPPYIECPEIHTSESSKIDSLKLTDDRASLVSCSVSTKSGSESSETQWCITCGHIHSLSTPHIYEYSEVVDTDLLCRLCRRPLVDPLDTKCGHTFCSPCLKSHLAVQALCPEDKHIINYLECQQSSNLVKRLLDKLLVICPNSEHCSEVLSRCDVESHLTYWCRGAVVACVNNKLGCPYLGLRTKQSFHRWNCQFQPLQSSATIAKAGDCNHPSETFPNISRHTGASIRTSGSDPAYNDGSQTDSIKSYETSGGIANKESFLPDGHVMYIELNMERRNELGVSLVGGSDTPLLCVIIQEIYLDGIAAQDARLRPGDQILEVNGRDLAQETHHQACRVLSSSAGTLCRLTIYREQQLDLIGSGTNPFRVSKPDMKPEIVHIVLSKSQEKRLGIKLVGKKNCLGLYVLELVNGEQADLDGRLQKDDRILEINGIDLSRGTQEQAAQLIRAASDHVYLVVARFVRSQTPDIIRATGGENVTTKSVTFISSPTVVESHATVTVPSNSQPVLQPNPKLSTSEIVDSNRFHADQSSNQSIAYTKVCQERVVTLAKHPGESLGISVAGGVASQRGDVPIYVTNLTQSGLASLSGSVFRGDILLAVNEVELLGLSHERAVDALKAARDSCTQVALRLLKGPEDSSEPRNFIPSWMFWLQLPRYCQIPRLVVLTRDPVIGLGFSIIGGNDFCLNTPEDAATSAGPSSAVENKFPCSPRPIVIKSIVPGSPCYNDGRLKCGDILLSVDHYPLTDIAHTHAVALLKHCVGEVILRVVSWPGTIV